MGRLYTIESWALIALGVVHVSAAPRFFDAFTSQALWFVSGGLLMALVGVLNLLNRAYGRGARGLRIVCLGVNTLMVAFGIAVGLLSRASLASWIIVLGIVVPLTVLSSLRAVTKAHAT